MHRLTFVHRASTLRTASPCTGGTAKGCWVGRIDDVHNDAARFESFRIHWHGIAGVHS